MGLRCSKCEKIGHVKSKWEDIMGNNRFSMNDVYKILQRCEQKVVCSYVMYGNMDRSSACFIMWLTCHRKLSTKDRLSRFGLINNKNCCFYHREESIDHIFFLCPVTRHTWIEILEWIQVQHTPVEWNLEIDWIIQQVKGKSARASVIKLAISETINEL